MPILGTIASSTRQGQNVDLGAMFPLQVITVGPAGATSVTFTNIPSTYTHLQIRYIARSTRADVQDVIRIEFNADSTSGNYARHWLQGTGSAANAFGEGNFSDNLRILAGNSTGSNTFGCGVIDVLDYANTNKNTTTRTLSGYDNNGDGQVALGSGLWKNTAAITSIVLTAANGNIMQNSQFALYAVKAAS